MFVVDESEPQKKLTECPPVQVDNSLRGGARGAALPLGRARGTQQASSRGPKTAVELLRRLIE